jgi:hypothetical protein
VTDSADPETREIRDVRVKQPAIDTRPNAHCGQENLSRSVADDAAVHDDIRETRERVKGTRFGCERTKENENINEQNAPTEKRPTAPSNQTSEHPLRNMVAL